MMDTKNTPKNSSGHVASKETDPIDDTLKYIRESLRPGQMCIGYDVLPIGPVMGKVHRAKSFIFLPDYELKPEPFDDKDIERLGIRLSQVDGFRYTTDEKNPGFTDPKNVGFLSLISLLREDGISKHYLEQLTNRFIRTYKPPYAAGIKWHICDFYRREDLMATIVHDIPDGSKLDVENHKLEHYYIWCDYYIHLDYDYHYAHYVRLKDHHIKHPEFKEMPSV